MNGNNRIIIQQSLKKFGETNGITGDNSELFELYTLSLITKKLKLSFQDLEDSVTDGSLDGGVDSFVILINDNYVPDIYTAENHKYTNNTITKFIICQSKQESSFKESPIDKLIVTIAELFNLSNRREDMVDRFNCLLLDKVEIALKAFEQTILNGGKVEVDYYYATLAEDTNSLSASYNSKVKQLKELSKQIFKNDVNFYNFSCEELL